MAIDTAAKRRSSAAARRMPWMRRFAPAPDGSVSQADRQQGTWVYAGIEAGEVAGAAYYPPRFTIARRNVATLDIERLNVQTADIARRNVATLEIDRG